MSANPQSFSDGTKENQKVIFTENPPLNPHQPTYPINTYQPPYGTNGNERSTLVDNPPPINTYQNTYPYNQFPSAQVPFQPTPGLAKK